MAPRSPEPSPSFREWLIWQLADSAFPTGGFAHSGGLEAVWQHGEIKNSNDLCAFLETSLLHAGHAAIPFVSAAFDQPESFAEIDRTCDAFISNHVTNRASRVQGQSLLACAVRAFPHPYFKEFRAGLADETALHFAAVFGVITRVLGIEKLAALRLFMFTQLRGWISSSVRLGIIGPLQGQSIQSALSVRAEEILESCASLIIDEISQTAPLLDIFQGSQDRLYSRLFQS
jgi:urease accessory protein